MDRRHHFFSVFIALSLASLLLTACQVQGGSLALAMPEGQEDLLEVEQAAGSLPAGPRPTSLPERPLYSPGEPVEYIAQTGDTLPVLAMRFNTTVEEILEANPFIPADATTMPPGMPMSIPIYYVPLWGSPYKILPDSLFVYGPLQSDFDTPAFVASQPGWLKDYVGFAGGGTRSGAEVVDIFARNYSVSPRLLLALLEYHSGALSQPVPPPGAEHYALGYYEPRNRGFNAQLNWTANTLNNNYYSWRTGDLQSITRRDGSLERPDPWQNAASVALQAYFSRLTSLEDYQLAISPQGFAQTYAALFGDPWEADQPHIPGSLVQPEFVLPFRPGTTWALTGGPHTGWGTGAPWAALDFAPPSVAGGCVPTDEPATAVAAGVVVRSEPGVLVLDLDGDGDENTGWTVFYLHIATEGRARVGTVLQAGEPLGFPSCEGGRSTGTHIHIARKYNGEWVPAAGALAFNLEGWVAYNGTREYEGTMRRFSQTVTASTGSSASTFLTAGAR
jgi:LasA protease